MSAEDVVEGVLRHFGCARENPAPEWSALTEFADAPGGWGSGRCADIFLMRAWRSGPGHVRVLVEVKVTRADLRAELACPQKMAEVGRYANRWYLATPPGLSEEIDLPAGLGLLEVTGSGCREVLAAAKRPAEAMPELCGARLRVKGTSRHWPSARMGVHTDGTDCPAEFGPSPDLGALVQQITDHLGVTW